MTHPDDAAEQPEPDESETSLAEWVAELADRLQVGEPLDLAAYANEHPERADQLQRLLPTIAMMADLRSLAGLGTDEMALAKPPSVGTSEPLGDFQILREIGRGGMGVVYEAVQLPLNRRVALKVLPQAAALDSRHLQRFQFEAKAVAKLDHHNIVPIYSIGDDRGVPYYAMRLIDGQNLAEIVCELRLIGGQGPPGGDVEVGAVTRSMAGGRFAPQAEPNEAPPEATRKPAHVSPLTRPPEPDPSNNDSIRSGAFIRTAARFGMQAADALAHAHDGGVVHRDIKPANLLIDADGHLWVTDFGLARLQGDSELTRTGDLMGTLRYMSPEQALGRRNRIDCRTDIYSLGVTLYELLTLQPAFDSDDRQELLHRITQEEPCPPRRLNAAIPADLETIVKKAMAKDIDDRYHSAREMADDLKRFLANEPIRARPVGRLEPLKRWCLRPERVRDAGVALVSLGVLMCAIGTLTYVSYLVRLVGPKRPGDFILDLVVALVVFDLPPIWCGIKALAGKRYGLWLGLLTSLNFLFWLLVSLFGWPVLDYGGLYEDLSSRAPFVLLILLLVVHTVFRVLIGLAACRAIENDSSVRADLEGSRTLSEVLGQSHVKSRRDGRA